MDSAGGAEAPKAHPPSLNPPLLLLHTRVRKPRRSTFKKEKKKNTSLLRDNQRSCDPWFTRQVVSPLHYGGSFVLLLMEKSIQKIHK